jgi:hypothetical protein
MSLISAGLSTLLPPECGLGRSGLPEQFRLAIANSAG